MIDDSRAMRGILKRGLVELGFEVSEAFDGRNGLETLAASPRPDLILVDWNMPRMNGLEFIQTIRQDARFERTCIVMVTTET